MNERELLEAAAKAAGIPLAEAGWNGEKHLIVHGGSCTAWNPLTDDGDALRLAVKLQLNELWFDRSTGRPEVVCGKPGSTIAVEPIRDDPYAATRRAIVRAAAALHPNGGSTP